MPKVEKPSYLKWKVVEGIFPDQGRVLDPSQFHIEVSHFRVTENGIQFLKEYERPINLLELREAPRKKEKKLVERPLESLGTAHP